MHHLVAGDAELFVRIVEQSRIGFVGAGLLGRDDPVDMPAQLRDIAGNDVVVGVGDDAQLEAHFLELREGRDHLGKRRHPRNRRG
ncbi:hypothetical protein D3C87_1055100 [compost metagenome]